jgi:hypothetical protein
VRRQHFRDERFELLHHRVVDVAALFLGQRLLQRAALIHRGCRDDAAAIGHLLHACQLTWGELHARLLWGEIIPGVISGIA